MKLTKLLINCIDLNFRVAETLVEEFVSTPNDWRRLANSKTAKGYALFAAIVANPETFIKKYPLETIFAADKQNILMILHELLQLHASELVLSDLPMLVLGYAIKSNLLNPKVLEAFILEFVWTNKEGRKNHTKPIARTLRYLARVNEHSDCEKALAELKALIGKQVNFKACRTMEQFRNKKNLVIDNVAPLTEAKPLPLDPGPEISLTNILLAYPEELAFLMAPDSKQETLMSNSISQRSDPESRFRFNYIPSSDSSSSSSSNSGSLSLLNFLTEETSKYKKRGRDEEVEQQGPNKRIGFGNTNRE